MEEKSEQKLEFRNYEVPVEDKFLYERIRRTLLNTESPEQLKEIGLYLADLCTQRNAVIKGLIKDLTSPNNVVLKS
tara:strand:+ start:397 stop:624 length:228 start_codon:yes stop_codon:yes gene_type:complete